MEKDTLILAKEQYYSLDCYKTQLNNNVLVVGASGAGKTRSIVTPNILQATGSYVVSDPKGNLYTRYKDYLELQGYEVKKLDFTNPKNSACYNFFQYIHSIQDIVKIAHMMEYSSTTGMHVKMDPFWDEAAQLLLQACMAYLYERYPMEERTFHNLLRLISLCMIDSDDSDSKNPLDIMMDDHERDMPDSYAVSTYRKFRIAANKTLKSIIITVNARLGLMDTPEIKKMTGCDEMDIDGIGKRKTAVFVCVSDTDRSMDTLANIFFTQAMNELCTFADKECKDNVLPVPVRFILDDFATNCKIAEFPRMISSIRSRGISTMLMLQSESQLKACYGNDDKTIIANCDTYVYLGGNDIETAKSVAARSDVPVKKILNMPIGTNWIFRRGQAPVNGQNFELEPFLREKEIR